jgi:protocatechuate 3,4-dioxygenase beta subunit
MSWYKNCFFCILTLLLAAVSMPKAFAATIIWNENWTVLTSDGKPASGAVVRIYRSKNGDSAVTVTKTVADASGAFQLTYPNEGEDRWRQGHDEIILVSKGSESVCIETSDGRFAKSKALNLIPAISHKIHVVDGSSSKPVVGVPIFISSIQTNQGYISWNEHYGEPWSVKTDANGDATFPLIPKTSYLGFGVGGDKYAALDQTQITQRPTVETLHVAIAGSVSGIVMIESTGALVQASVRAFRKSADPGENNNNDNNYVQTDANGSFTFKKLPPGTYTLSLDLDSSKEGKEWTAPARSGVKVVSGKAVSDASFMLVHGAVIKGVVREKGTNKPVNNNPNYRVNLNFYGPAAPEGESYGMYAQIQQDGSYQICVPPGDQTVNIYDQDAASGNNQRTENIHVASGETKEFNIDLEPAPKKMTVHGKVLSADGAPVSSASVYTISGQYNTDTQTTDANGAFTITNMTVGGVVAAATKDAGTDGFATLKDDSDKSDLVLTLSEKPAPMATGKVADSSGKPLEGVTVNAFFSRPGYDVFMGLEYLTAITNKNGEYSVGPLFAGARYNVNANAPGYAGDSTNSLEALHHKGLTFDTITLAPKNGHIHGQVISLSEQPIAGATVAESGGYPSANSTVTDKNGYFTLKNLPQGHCNIFFTAPGYNSTGMQANTGIDDAEFSLTKEDPSAKNAQSGKVATGDATLTGKVVDEQGKPVAGQSISMYYRVSDNNGLNYPYIRPVKTDENGQYQFKNLVKGASVVVQFDMNYSQNGGVGNDAVSYFAFGDSQLINSLDEAQVAKDIVLKVRDSLITGKVVDSQGNPVKSASVNIRQSKCNDWTQTDEKGEFRFKVLSKGDVTVSVNDRETAYVANLVAQPGADNLVLNLAEPKYHGDGTNARKVVKAAKAKAISEGKALLIDLYQSGGFEQRAFFDDKTVKPIIDKYFEVAHLDLMGQNAKWDNIDAQFYLSLYKSTLIGISRSGKVSVIDETQIRKVQADPSSSYDIFLKVLRQTEPKITDAESATLLDALKRAITLDM